MLIDFFIGFGVVNALPHYLFGRMKVRVLSLFGFSPTGNLCYSALCMVLSLSLFGYKYGFGTISEHLLYAGALFVVWAYILGWDFMNCFLRKDKQD